MNKYSINVLVTLLFLLVMVSDVEARTIIVLMDGTWNEPDKKLDSNEWETAADVGDATNVELLDKLYLNKSDDQLVQYHKGIGTDGKVLKKVIDGAVGKSAQDKVNIAYKALTDIFNPNRDHIAIFGFSRGATTSRLLANKIANEGLNNNMNVEIVFLGLWDTVAALGVPESKLSEFKKEYSLEYDKLKISENVISTVHFVALDENRATFLPTLLTLSSDETKAKEIWFAGSHGDVGGGWPVSDEGGTEEDKLSDLPLYCMLKAAKSENIQINADHFKKLESRVLDKGISRATIHEKSFALKNIVGGKEIRVFQSWINTEPMLDASVVYRIEKNSKYKPDAIDTSRQSYAINTDCYD